jgi:hypothetical protein
VSITRAEETVFNSAISTHQIHRQSGEREDEAVSLRISCVFLTP